MKYAYLFFVILIGCGKYDKGEFVGQGGIPDPYSSGQTPQLRPSINDIAASSNRNTINRAITDIIRFANVGPAVERDALIEIGHDMCHIYTWLEGDFCRSEVRGKYRKEEEIVDRNYVVKLFAGNILHKRYVISEYFETVEELRSSGNKNLVLLKNNENEACFNGRCLQLR